VIEWNQNTNPKSEKTALKKCARVELKVLQKENDAQETVGWEKPDPIHEMAITVGESTHCHLR
jgi:hypothetical protein